MIKQKLITAFVLLALIMEVGQTPAMAMGEDSEQAIIQSEMSEENEVIQDSDEEDPSTFVIGESVKYDEEDGLDDGSIFYGIVDDGEFKEINDEPTGFVADVAESNYLGALGPEQCGESVYWSVDGTTLSITGSGAMYDFSTSNPAPWLGFIGDKIENVVIGEGITYVGSQSFYGMKKLTNVKFPSTLTGFGRVAFADCNNLKDVVIPNKVTSLPYALFGNCYNLNSISMPSVTKLDDYVFQAAKIDTFTISSKLTNIAPLAFYLAKIKNYQVESGNTVYKEKDGVVFKDNYKTLSFFPAKSSVSSYKVPETVEVIDDCAFACSNDLHEIDLSNVKKLNYSCFLESGLRSLVIPDSVTEVDKFVFAKNYWLKSVKLGKGMKSTGYEMFYCGYSLSDIDFGNVSELDSLSFAYCKSLTEVNLPKTITKIGNGCFGSCEQLSSVKTSNLKCIPYQAFAYCNYLKDVDLNEGITDIYRCTFLKSSLNKVVVPKSTTFVHTDAFDSYTELVVQNTEVRPYSKHGYRLMQDVSITGSRNYNKAYEVLELVNQERAKNGLNPLYMDESLLETAMKRGAEISICFSHTCPEESSCFDRNDLMEGENIAVNQKNARSVMDSWMKSEGHKDNILNSKYQIVGIGCFEHNGNTYWVQCFSGKKNASTSCNKPSNRTVTQVIPTAIEEFTDAAMGSGVVINPKTYKYVYDIRFSREKPEVGESTKSSLMLQNAGLKDIYSVVDNVGIKWSCSNSNIASVDNVGNVKTAKVGSADIIAEMKYQTIKKTLNVSDKTDSSNVKFYLYGININKKDRDEVWAQAYLSTNGTSQYLEYSWYATLDGQNWMLISDWKRDYPWIQWNPQEYGDYTLVVKVRIKDDDSTIQTAAAACSFHSQIKGICQMPYDGAGGGYLIGIESYDNPDNSYKYEMLILDCTLLAQGKDAWIYTTNKCHAPGNCLWTVWQPQYGYYWTLFRIFDKNDTLIDEACYGFVNAY